MMESFLKMKRKQQKMEIEHNDDHIPWVEKYRPNNLSELAYQEEVTRSFQGIVKSGNLPHLLLYGAAGTGKTSSILAMAKQLFGPVFYRKRILQLNASDERGIAVVRQKIKRFAMDVTVKSTDKNYPCPNFKIIILDEADSMTTQAQSALRRVIEDYSSTTRFAIICNYITKIIEPLASRCVKFRFKMIPREIQLAKLEEICEKEKLKIDKEIVYTLMSQGDLRRSINSLQSLHNVSTISEILPMPQKVCSQLFDIMVNANHLRDVINATENIVSQGWPYDEVLQGLLTQVMNYKNQKKKAQILEVIARADQAINQNGTDLQLLQCITTSFYILHLH